ncbi:MAG: PHP domain-containing protein [Planctomycetes bacterium]|nr:PHP domain-containing protein [Planctomycetota bacterium]
MKLAGIDLHTHSTCSDGLLDPAALVAEAAGQGAEVLALTDHDTMRGCGEAASAAAAAGVRFLPGMELSTRHGDHDVHLLALFLEAPDLGAFAAQRAEARRERFWAMVERLDGLGLRLDRDDLARRIQGASPGRPHLARALVAAGHVADDHEAFGKWLARGRPAHLAQRMPTTAEAIAMVRGWGGVSSVAHPALDALEPVLGELAEHGLDAVEAYHGGHSAEQAAALAAQSASLGLLVSGGSDFHGPAQGRPPGRSPLPAEAWAALLERLEARGDEDAA